jgi:hypothetical protein
MFVASTGCPVQVNTDRCEMCHLAQFVLIQLFQVWSSRSETRLWRGHRASGCQRKMNAKKSSQHSDGIVAPQSAVTPIYLLRHAHDPERHAVITSINKLPPPPNFPSCRWADFIGIIIAISAETIFMAVVMLACIKLIVRVVFCEVGFKRPVLKGSQTRRRRSFAEWNDVIIDQVLIVAGRMRIEFAFRHLLAVAAGHRYPIPMGTKIYHVKESGADGKEFSRCFIVLGLEDDQKWSVCFHDAARFSPRRPTRVDVPFWVIGKSLECNQVVNYSQWCCVWY